MINKLALTIGLIILPKIISLLWLFYVAALDKVEYSAYPITTSHGVTFMILVFWGLVFYSLTMATFLESISEKK